MILMYHKVDLIAPTNWWVSATTFKQQLDELISSGRRFVFLADYSDPQTEVCITFDDGCDNVFRHAVPALRERQIPFEVFIIGDYIGRWNQADKVEPLTKYMSFDSLLQLNALGGRIQWHTKSHPHLKGLSKEKILEECAIPQGLKKAFSYPNFSWLAYPYGSHDELSESIAMEQFEGALSVMNENPNSKWKLNRVMCDNQTKFNLLDKVY